jgi:hypothetical protein
MAVDGSGVVKYELAWACDFGLMSWRGHGQASRLDGLFRFSFDPHLQLGAKMQESVGSVSGHQVESAGLDVRPVYQRPSIRVLDEKEVLSAFQVTVATITWWVM